jgi:hypothetical protein
VFCAENPRVPGNIVTHPYNAAASWALYTFAAGRYSAGFGKLVPYDLLFMEQSKCITE